MLLRGDIEVTNLNVRTTGNGAIYVQYHEDGKAKDAAFVSWSEFVAWLSNKVLP